MTVSEIRSKISHDDCVRRFRVNISCSRSPLGWNQFIQYVVQTGSDLTGKSLEFLLPTGVIKLLVEDVSMIDSKGFQCLIAE